MTAGKKAYMWFGPKPRVLIRDPELIKDILSRPNEFQRPQHEPLRDSIVSGLVVSEGEKWTKHRHIINPAFHLDSIKVGSFLFPNKKYLHVNC